MNGPATDTELQCEWAKTLAASGNVLREEVEALVKAALSARSTGVKGSRTSRLTQSKTVDGNSVFGEASSIRPVCRIAEIRLRCLLPLCSFLEESEGQVHSQRSEMTGVMV